MRVMRIVRIFAVLAMLICSAVAQAPGGDNEVSGAITRFHEALQKRDVTAIEKLVSNDLVVFENGGRNDGWADFRDNHLIPEMKEPAPESKWEIVRVERKGEMAWGYTSETFTSAKGNKLQLWSVFVLQKSGKEWKIRMLDWSIGRAK
jgi:ketosteroid isomerase-like protein